MAQLNPYLHFDRNCREAMNFYKDCLGGKLQLMTVREMPEMAAQMPPEWGNDIMHSSLISGEMCIFGSDLSKNKLSEGNTIHLCISCKTEEELDSLFSKLSADGKVTDAPAEMPWGAKYGSLIDKYGKNWMFNFDRKNSM